MNLLNLNPGLPTSLKTRICFARQVNTDCALYTGRQINCTNVRRVASGEGRGSNRGSYEAFCFCRCSLINQYLFIDAGCVVLMLVAGTVGSM